MATCTIKTRSHGDLTFYVADHGGYVRLYSDHWHGCQPCAGGGFRGSTLRADALTLQTIARAWWRGFRRQSA